MIDNNPKPVTNEHAPPKWGPYCLLLLSLPVLYLLTAAIVVPSKWALRHTRNQYQANMGYADRLSGVRCEVLIYGDSSAMVGVDPNAVQAQTGLTACNISEIEGVTTVMGTELVDEFLRKNPRPRFILFVFAPDDLNSRKGWTGPSRMEEIVYLLQTRRSWHTVWLLLQHPTDGFGALEASLRILARDWRKPALSEASVHLRDNHRGWYPYPKIPATRCPPFTLPTAVDRTWLQTLRDKYESPETRVLVLTIPVPACDPYFQIHASEIQGVTDNSLEAYPLEQFSGVDIGLHLIEPGVEKFSSEIARLVRAQMTDVPAKREGPQTP